MCGPQEHADGPGPQFPPLCRATGHLPPPEAERWRMWSWLHLSLHSTSEIGRLTETGWLEQWTSLVGSSFWLRSSSVGPVLPGTVWLALWKRAWCEIQW